MNHLTFYVIIAILLLALYSQPIKAQSNDPITTTSTLLASLPLESLESDNKVTELQLRLTEISILDKSNMTALEKKKLRHEERSIKRELKQNSGGLYISGGALIIIIVLLILFN